MAAFLIQGLSIGLAAALSPGPLLALFMARALESGWKQTLPLAFAPLLSDGPIIAVSLLLLARLPEGALDALRFAGGGFLIYLAVRSRPRDHASPPKTPANLREAVLVNLLNPNPYLFWAAVLGPTFLKGWRVQPAFGLAFAGAFYAAMIAVYLGWIAFFGSAGSVHPRARRLLSWISVGGLAAFGLWQIAASFVRG